MMSAPRRRYSPPSNAFACADRSIIHSNRGECNQDAALPDPDRKDALRNLGRTAETSARLVDGLLPATAPDLNGTSHSDQTSSAAAQNLGHVRRPEGRLLMISPSSVTS